MLYKNKMSNYDEIMKLALERGFYFPSCEIYADASAGFWEYGPMGKINSLIYGEKRS